MKVSLAILPLLLGISTSLLLPEQARRLVDAAVSGDDGPLEFANVSFPIQCEQQEKVRGLAKKLSKEWMLGQLQHLSGFHTRYYNTDDGLIASRSIQDTVKRMIQNSSATRASVSSFSHPWRQKSVIATIPGRTNDTIVLGAHLDSINLHFPLVTHAPGADDDGSGVVTIMDVFRVLLHDKAIAQSRAHNTIEFHWYSAEEIGLKGSRDIFDNYKRLGRNVKAMLQQDMTGYIEGTLKAGQRESLGVITDFVHPGLTEFVKTVIETYCTIPWVETKCGYPCSDHFSATNAGFPSAFVLESAKQYSNPHIHSAKDVIDHLSLDHMRQHARMALGFAYELVSYNFQKGTSQTPELEEKD